MRLREVGGRGGARARKINFSVLVNCHSGIGVGWGGGMGAQNQFYPSGEWSLDGHQERRGGRVVGALAHKMNCTLSVPWHLVGGGGRVFL